MPITVCAEMLGPRDWSPGNQPGRILKAEPSLHGWWTTDSKNDLEAENLPRDPLEPPKPWETQALSPRERVKASKLWAGHNNQSASAAGVWLRQKPSPAPVDLHSSGLKPQEMLVLLIAVGRAQKGGTLC